MRWLLAIVVMMALAMPAWADYWFVDGTDGNDAGYDGEQTAIMTGVSHTTALVMSHSAGLYFITMASEADAALLEVQRAAGRDILHVSKAGVAGTDCWLKISGVVAAIVGCSRFETDGDDITGEVSVDIIGTGPEKTVGAAYADAGDGDTIWIAPGTYATKLTYAVAESHTYKNLKTEHPLLGGNGSGFCVELQTDDDTKTLTFDGIDFYQDAANYAFWYEDAASIDSNLMVKNSVITCEYALFGSNAGEPAAPSTRTVLFEDCAITSTGTVSQIQLRSGTSFTMRDCTVAATSFGANSFCYISGGWRNITFDNVDGINTAAMNLSETGYGFRATNAAVTEGDQITIKDCDLGAANFVYYPDAGSSAWNWLIDGCTFTRYGAVSAGILVGTDDPDVPDDAYGQFIVRNCVLDADSTATDKHLVLFGAGTFGAVLEDSYIYGVNKTDWCVVLKGGNAVVQRNRIIGPRGVTCASTKNAYVCANSIIGLPYDSGVGADDSWAFSYYSQPGKAALCNGTVARNNIFLVDATGLDTVSGDDLYCVRAGTAATTDDLTGLLDYNVYAIRDAVNSGGSVTAYASMEGNAKTTLADIQAYWPTMNGARISQYNDANSIQATRDPLPNVAGTYATDVWRSTVGLAAGSNGLDIGAWQRRAGVVIRRY